MKNKNQEIRLQKFLSQVGIASRRKSEELILQGFINVNGNTAKIGDRINPNKDVVFLNGKKIKLLSENKYYIMLYKPRGYITTMSDEKNRKCVAQLIKDIPVKLHPVGRLDKDSEGLLLMTNDGDFTNNIIHPSKHIFKTYRVTVRPGISEDQIIKLCTGIEIDNKETLPAKVDVISQEPNRCVLEISIQEGRNRQVRKMCESLNLEVARLKRISIGMIKLGMLKPGSWRNLSNSEISSFK